MAFLRVVTVDMFHMCTSYINCLSGECNILTLAVNEMGFNNCKKIGSCTSNK
uniref:Uncharacterized protein n=1 Tax=Ciona intestinalis TaxID=7719 RepID=H2XPB6_CIOIN